MTTTDAPPVSDADAAVYVHFPYCAHRCAYCDFNAHAIDHDDRAYADAVIAEIDHRGRHLDAPNGLRSIFFGGGTPSRWAPSQVGRVVRHLETTFGFRPNIEITLEANPGTVAQERFEGFVDAGINRFSIGVQSLDDRELTALGRIHNANDAAKAVATAVRIGARVSLDLMYGFPGQKWSDVRATIDRALTLGTEHISAYALTVEPTTVLGRQAATGRFIPMPDDDQADLMERVQDYLEAAALHRYEVSNFARPGAVSIHNCLYWMGGAYLGVGAGAHSYLPDRALQSAQRRENSRAPAAYLRSITERTFTCTFEEQLDRRQILVDRLLTAMRVRWGLDLAALDRRFNAGGVLVEHLGDELRRLQSDGFVVLQNGRYKPTDRGFLFNDSIARRLCGRLDTFAEGPATSRSWLSLDSPN
ncbi:MAG: radical SAM family heme chaperone HemW [Myxococcota bacterium]